MLGILWIFIFYGLALATLIFVPIFAVQAIKSLRSDEPERKRTATIAFAFSVLSLAPMLLYFGRMYLWQAYLYRSAASVPYQPSWVGVNVSFVTIPRPHRCRLSLQSSREIHLPRREYCHGGERGKQKERGIEFLLHAE